MDERRLVTIRRCNRDGSVLSAETSRNHISWLLDENDRLTAALAASEAARERLRRAFIRHRTETHEVAPTFCKTCAESDAAIEEAR